VKLPHRISVSILAASSLFGAGWISRDVGLPGNIIEFSWWNSIEAIFIIAAIFIFINKGRIKSNFNQMSAMLEGSTDAYVEFDRDFRFISVNRGAALILNNDCASLIGRKPTDIFLEFDLTSFLTPLKNGLLNGTPVQFQEFFAPTGAWLDVRAYPHKNRLSVFFHDVSEHRRIAEALKNESERRRKLDDRFEAALSVNPLVVFTLDSELRYTWVYNNQVAWRDKEILGKRPDEIFDEETGPTIMEFFRSVLASGALRRRELTLRPKGALYDLHFVSSAKPIYSLDGQVIGLTGASFDITHEVKRREELALAREDAMLAKAEADRASLARSKFLAAASHDLRQPVQSLVLLIGVLKERLDATPLANVTDHMEKAVHALCLLLDSMLDISKLDAGVISPRLENVDLGALMSRLAAEYSLRAAEQKLRFIARPTSIRSLTDPLLLERVLRNLIENALRYTHAGGVLLACRRRGDMVRIDVIDTGVGISTNQLEAIYEEFHQAGNATKDRSQGLGLGLAIVRRIVTLLGGSDEVSSVLGKGSRFSVTLPIAMRQESGESSDPLDEAPPIGKTVLIIDDDDVLRASLATMAKDWGFTVYAAEDSETALNIVQSGCDIDIIVADYRLGGEITGLDTVAQIRQLRQRAIPSMIITGDTAPERIREVHESHLRILHKPVATRELRKALASMLKEEFSSLDI